MYNDIIQLGLIDPDPEDIKRRRIAEARRREKVRQFLEEGRKRKEEEDKKEAERRKRSRQRALSDLQEVQKRIGMPVTTDTAPHVILGNLGEDIAANYLRQQGYYILNRNWNLHKGCELDIVARKDGVLYFVEVKTRRYGDMDGVYSPFNAINYFKKRHLRRAANYYRICFNLRNIESHFLAIGIIFRREDDYDLEIRTLNI